MKFFFAKPIHLIPDYKEKVILLNSIGIKGFDSVTIGKYIEMNFDNISKKDAEILVDKSCKKLLVNPNTQTYTYEIKE